MDDFSEKLQMVAALFPDPINEQSTPLQHGNYYGGVYNGKKYLYSELMIRTLPIEKLESFIKKQIGI